MVNTKAERKEKQKDNVLKNFNSMLEKMNDLEFYEMYKTKRKKVKK